MVGILGKAQERERENEGKSVRLVASRNGFWRIDAREMGLE